jgi:hypothetical protein
VLCVAVDVAADSLPCDHAFTDAATINAEPASPTIVIALIVPSSANAVRWPLKGDRNVPQSLQTTAASFVTASALRLRARMFLLRRKTRSDHSLFADRRKMLSRRAWQFAAACGESQA